MNLPKISLIHATFRSLGVSKAVRNEWFRLASQPLLVEHCMAFQDNDYQIRQEYGLGNLNLGVTPDAKTKFVATLAQESPSAVRNWNAAAAISTGQLLLGIADDLIPPRGWDEQLRKMVQFETSSLCFWKLKDVRCENENNPSQDDILPRHPAMTRALYMHQGFFFDPEFVSVGCDDKLLCTGLMNGFIRDGRQLKLHHTSGKILKSTGGLNCGCEGNREVQPLTESQISIHDETWKRLSRDNMMVMPLGWVSLCENSAIPGIGTVLLSKQARNKPLLVLIFVLLTSRNIIFGNKVIFTLRFLKKYLSLTIKKLCL